MHKIEALVMGLVSTSELIGPDVSSKNIYVVENVESPDRPAHYLLEIGHREAYAHPSRGYFISDGENSWACHGDSNAPPIRSAGCCSYKWVYPIVRLKIGIRVDSYHSCINKAIEEYMEGWKNED